MQHKYGLSVNNLMRLAANKAGANWLDAVAIAKELAEASGLDGADWLETDLGDQFDLTGESDRRRRERFLRQLRQGV
jgi:hypothetical protein